MKQVHLLSFIYFNEALGSNDIRNIGIYSSRAKLTEAMEYGEQLIGLKNKGEFEYYTYLVDDTYWPSDIMAESMSWEEFKAWSESRLEHSEIQRCWGFQVQPGTKWNPGLTHAEIDNLEKVFGFEFPEEYKKMLLTMNGFDLEEISIDPDGKEENEFGRSCYKYPDDLENVQWLISEIKDHIEYVNGALTLAGFDAENAIGFIPLYAHRALVVFKDKLLTPVISIHQGTDVIVYCKSLMVYWAKELL